MPAVRWLVLGAALGLLGCSGRRVPAPPLSPERAAREALAQYDRNKDGSLDADELSLSPALAASLKALDKDKDGRLSEQEIADRIRFYQDSRVGLVALTIQITSEGKPLAGATMTLVPEKFLGDGVKSASGVSDERGLVLVRAEGADLPGVACGLYRVEVSKKDPAGRETVPARYNEKTTLGLEVGPDSKEGVRRFALRSP